MLVIIPTYKRLNTLPWVIKSLLNCELPFLEDKPRLAIVNNYPPYTKKLGNLIELIKNENNNAENWEWIKVDRKESLYPIDNWYNAIFELALENEIVFLHGDDDLFIKDSLKSRFEAINNNFNLLLSKAIGGFTFLSNNFAHFKIKDLSLGLDGRIVKISFENFRDFSPVFIGNNTYKNDTYFQDIYKELQKLLSYKQGWVPYNERTLMIPYYLPLMYLKNNLSVGGLNKICVIRGTSLREKLNAPYGVPGWNSGFLGLLAYDFLNNDSFKKIVSLDSARQEQLNMAKTWYLTFFIDRRIPNDLRITAQSKVNINVGIKDYYNSFKMVIKDLFGLSNLRIRFDNYFNRHIININEFIEESI